MAEKLQEKNIECRYFLGVDDFGFLLPGEDEILQLKDAFPNFKITCFTVPFPQQFFWAGNAGQFKVARYKEWAKIINSYDWLEVALHGFSHTKREFDCGYNKAMMILRAVENLFEQIGLKYKKLFKAPYWQYSYDSLNALVDKDYVIALDRNRPITIPEGGKAYYYNWSFDEKLPREKIVKGHGHTTPRGVRNAIAQCYENIIKQIPKDAKFGFISELYGI